MSVAREAAGSSTTSPAAWSAGAGWSGGSGSLVMTAARSRRTSSGEQVPAEQVAGVRSLHVRPGVHDDVPVAGLRRIDSPQSGPGDPRPRAIRDHLVEGEHDPAALRAAAEVDVRDMRRVGAD